MAIALQTGQCSEPNLARMVAAHANNPAMLPHRTKTAGMDGTMDGPVLSRLILPLPPSVNHSYMRRGKCTFKTPEAKAWQEQAGWLARRWYRGPLLTNKTILNIWVFWNDGRRRDCDNLLKLVQDALTGIVWKDDYYCLPRVIDWQIDKGNGRIEIEIKEA